MERFGYRLQDTLTNPARACQILSGTTGQGVKVTGTDSWSWDAPFVHTKQKFLETGDASLIWEGHKVGRQMAYCHLEKLHNLESLPPHNFLVSCFPVKIKNASAGWTRAVAILT